MSAEALPKGGLLGGIPPWQDGAGQTVKGAGEFVTGIRGRDAGFREPIARLETAKGCHEVFNLARRRGLAGSTDRYVDRITYSPNNGEIRRHNAYGTNTTFFSRAFGLETMICGYREVSISKVATATLGRRFTLYWMRRKECGQFHIGISRLPGNWRQALPISWP